MLDYPVDLTPDDNGTILATFPDLPGATFGDDEADALGSAVGALETALNAVVADRQELPIPSPANGRPTIAPTLMGALKLTVYGAMRARGWRRIDLGNAMGLGVHEIDRLLDLRRASTAARLEAAMWVCGRRFEIAVVGRETVQ